MDDKATPCHLSHKKMNEMTSSLTSLGDCHFDQIPGHKDAFFREIWEAHSLGQVSILAEQAWFLYHANDHYEKSKDWEITFGDVGNFLGFSRQAIRLMIRRWESVLSGAPQKVRGRPILFDQTQMKQIRDHIELCER